MPDIIKLTICIIILLAFRYRVTTDQFHMAVCFCYLLTFFKLYVFFPKKLKYNLN